MKVVREGQQLSVTAPDGLICTVALEPELSTLMEEHIIRTLENLRLYASVERSSTDPKPPSRVEMRTTLLDIYRCIEHEDGSPNEDCDMSVVMDGLNSLIDRLSE